MKNIKDICFIIQARTQSTRVPNKMLKPFANSNLFEIAINKVINSTVIPKDNFYLSVMDDELIEITPTNIRMRKMELDANKRISQAKKNKD